MECFGSDMGCLGLPWRGDGGYFGESLGLIGVIWMLWMPHWGLGSHRGMCFESGKVEKGELVGSNFVFSG